MTAAEIEVLFGEVADALHANESAPLTEDELSQLLRRLGPVAELIEQRWRRARPGGPDYLKTAHRDVRAAEAEAEAVRLQRAQIEAQRATLSDLRRVARRREALAALPMRYAEAADATAALEQAWSAFETAFAAVGAAAQAVASVRVHAGDAAPGAPDDAEGLPPRLLAVARDITARAHHLMRWPSDIASALSVEEPQPMRAKGYTLETV